MTRSSAGALAAVALVFLAGCLGSSSSGSPSGSSSGGGTSSSGAGSSSSGASGSSSSGSASTSSSSGAGASSSGTGASSGSSSSSAGSSGGATGPLDGTWTITAITCNGQPANSTISANYTAPNSATEAFTGATMVQTLDMSGCDLIYDWAATITSTTIALSPTGASCSPASCSAACGIDAPADTYTHVVAGNTLTVTSEASTQDGTCTGGGMSNPIVYTLTKP